MSTIKAMLEASADGTLHLPLPPELRHGKLQVTAIVQPAENTEITSDSAPLRGFGCLRGKISVSPDFDDSLDDFREYME